MAALPSAATRCGAPYLEERITKLRRAAEGLRRSSSEEEQLRGAELEKLAEELCVRKGEWEHANCGGD